MRHLALACFLCALPAGAAVRRFALLVGNDEGEAGEVRLRFAQADSVRVHETLRDVGGFPRENLVLLSGENADEARRALIALNDRIRSEVRADDQAVLVVYYSGHADADALHLGRSRLDLGELEALVRGSAATFRLLVLDACRSGALTRVKGGTRAEPFPVALEARLPGEGVVFLAATAASEDAQESDELRGSFFTHYLVSGLLGAADEDGDGAVTLAEAYDHAYAATLRATSRTLAGTQHPTFRYEYRGAGDVVLTSPGAARARATLRLPAGKTFLVLRGGSEGAVVAEVGARDATRGLSLAPGRYFLRGRDAGYLLEGEIALAVGDDRAVREGELARIEYARLVRKGGLSHATSIVAGPVLRSSVIDGASACWGGLVGVGVDLPAASLGTRIGACHGSFANDFLGAATNEVWWEARVGRAIDVGVVTLDFGLTAGATLLWQSFRSDGNAPGRTTLGGLVGAGLGATVPVGDGFFAGVGGEALTYFFSVDRGDGDALATRFSLRVTALIGKQL